MQTDTPMSWCEADGIVIGCLYRSFTSGTPTKNRSTTTHLKPELERMIFAMEQAAALGKPTVLYWDLNMDHSKFGKKHYTTAFLNRFHDAATASSLTYLQTGSTWNSDGKFCAATEDTGDDDDETTVTRSSRTSVLDVFYVSPDLLSKSVA